MTISTNIIAQVLATVLQGLNFATGIVPDKYKPYVMLVIAIVQAVVSFVAHYQPSPNQAAPAK